MLGHDALLHRWVAHTLTAAIAAAARSAPAGDEEASEAQAAAIPDATGAGAGVDPAVVHQSGSQISIDRLATILSYLSQLPITGSVPIKPPDTSTPQAAAAAAVQLASQLSLDLPPLQPSILEHGGPEILELVAAAALDQYAAISLPRPAGSSQKASGPAGSGRNPGARGTCDAAGRDAAEPEGVPIRDDTAAYVQPSLDWGLSSAQPDSPVSSGPAPARVGFRPTSSSTSAFAAALQAAESSSGASSRSTFSKHAGKQGPGKQHGPASQQGGADGQGQHQEAHEHEVCAGPARAYRAV